MNSKARITPKIYNYHFHSLFYITRFDHDCFKGFSGSSSWYISFFLLYTTSHSFVCKEVYINHLPRTRKKEEKLKKLIMTNTGSGWDKSLYLRFILCQLTFKGMVIRCYSTMHFDNTPIIICCRRCIYIYCCSR